MGKLVESFWRRRTNLQNILRITINLPIYYCKIGRLKSQLGRFLSVTEYFQTEIIIVFAQD